MYDNILMWDMISDETEINPTWSKCIVNSECSWIFTRVGGEYVINNDNLPHAYPQQPVVCPDTHAAMCSSTSPHQATIQAQ
jgi:hypothetical protein